MTALVPVGDASPVVICVRGPSRSGKTAFCERVLRALQGTGVRTAYIKRTHHELDLPDKASGRIWAAGPDAMLIRTPDRLQLSVPPVSAEAWPLIDSLPAEIDLVLFETHSPEPFPTVLSSLLDPAPGEQPLARWALDSVDADALAFASILREALPRDLPLARALRKAERLHGGHSCAGIVLGTRLALLGATILGVPVPDDERRLVVTAETARCAADAIQAVTGCHLGNRSLRLLDYGKLAATFVDVRTASAVRVAARSDLREQAAALAVPGESRDETQRRVYRELNEDLLFSVKAVSDGLVPFNQPGQRAPRVICVLCDEEVSDGREVCTDAGPVCAPCSRVSVPAQEGAAM